jgi:hypothetical protein
MRKRMRNEASPREARDNELWRMDSEKLLNGCRISVDKEGVYLEGSEFDHARIPRRTFNTFIEWYNREQNLRA